MLPCILQLGWALTPAPSPVPQPAQVVDLVVKGALINLLGFGTTLLGIATLTGTLVAQTISNATSTAIVTGKGGKGASLENCSLSRTLHILLAGAAA